MNGITFHFPQASLIKKVEAERDDLESLRRRTDSIVTEEKNKNKELASNLQELKDQLARTKDKLAEAESKHEIQVNYLMVGYMI